MSRYLIKHDDFDPGLGPEDPDWTVEDTTMVRHETWSFLTKAGAERFVRDREAYDEAIARGEDVHPPASNDDRYR